MVDTVFPPRNLPGNSDNWGRAVEGETKIIRKDLTQAVQKMDNGQRAASGQLAVIAQNIDTITAQQTQLANLLTQLQAVVDRIPLTQTNSGSASNFSLSGAYATKLTVNVTVPTGMSRVSMTAIGYMHVLDTLTGGVTSSRMRVGIGGNYSTDYWAAKDSGATQVLNVLNGTHSREYAVTGGSTIAVTVQAYGLNGSAFPTNATNFTSLSIISTFSNP